jgi:hypothetical protein
MVQRGGGETEFAARLLGGVSEVFERMDGER